MKNLKCRFFLAVTLILLLLAGCAGQNAGSTEGTSIPTDTHNSQKDEAGTSLILPAIQENYWGVYDNRCNVIYEPGFVSCNSINLTLLSAVPLEQEDVAVTLDTGWDMIYYLYPYDGEEGICYLNEDLLLMYQGVSAEELLEYHAGTVPPERKSEFNKWVFEYRALDDSKKPMIYRYTLDLGIPITEMDSNDVLDAFTITVNGETRTYQLGSIQNRVFETIEFPYDPNYSLNCDDNLNIFGANADVTSDGSIRLDNLKYTAVDDVVITGIRFFKGDDVQIQSISCVQNTADGAVIDTMWDMIQPIELMAGDSIFLNIQITDPFFAGTLGGWNTRYLLLEYRCGGETYELGIHFQFVQSLHDPFAYIAAEDGLDMLAYYSCR